MHYVVLVADNNQEFLISTENLLKRAGYRVITAKDPQTARRILTENIVDVAILDARLEDDKDDYDRSGIEIAVTPAFQSIPKIILTGYPVAESDYAQLLRLPLEGIPSAIRVIEKKNSGRPLLDEVQNVLRIHTRLQTAIDAAVLLKRDHDFVRSRNKWAYILYSIVMFVGLIITFTGVALALFAEEFAVSAVVSIAGLLVSVLGGHFMTRLAQEDRRLDTVYHREIFELYGLAVLLAYCDRLPAEEEQASRSRILLAAAAGWYSEQRST